MLDVNTAQHAACHRISSFVKRLPLSQTCFVSGPIAVLISDHTLVSVPSAGCIMRRGI